MQLQTTMATPAKASKYCEIASLADLQGVLTLHSGESMMVLGQGSNTLFKGDFSGLVIANKILGRNLKWEDEFCVELQFGAGESWHDIVEWSVDNGWCGLEQLALIPGLVGAAPIQNIGAYGTELKDIFVSLQCVDISTQAVLECDAARCQFDYRDSIFKQQWSGQKVITQVSLRLSKQRPNYAFENLYPTLSEKLRGEGILEEEITARNIFNAVCSVRRSKLPDPGIVPNSGSFFKNPVISEERYQVLLQTYPDLVAYPIDANYKVAAAWLIERAGFKGYANANGVGCYDKQALVIVNPQKCSGLEVLAFAQQIQQKVQELFAVDLEIEPRVY